MPIRIIPTNSIRAILDYWFKCTCRCQSRAKGLPRDVIKVADDVLRHLMAHNKKQITIAEIEAIIQENHLTKAPSDS